MYQLFDLICYIWYVTCELVAYFNSLVLVLDSNSDMLYLQLFNDNKILKS
jgi:hypothetical protein